MTIATEIRKRSSLADARATDGMVTLGLGWWESRRLSTGMLPRTVQEVPAVLALTVNLTYLVSVQRVTPARFTFKLKMHFGSNSALDVRALREFGPLLKHHRQPLHDDLGIVAFSGVPSYQVVEIDGADEDMSVYRRLILPLAEGDSLVSQLLVLAAPGRPPIL